MIKGPSACELEPLAPSLTYSTVRGCRCPCHSHCHWSSRAHCCCVLNSQQLLQQDFQQRSAHFAWEKSRERERERERERNMILCIPLKGRHTVMHVTAARLSTEICTFCFGKIHRERESERERERNKILCIPLMERHTMIHVPCSPLHV